MRWEKDHGLPIHRINREAKKSKVIALKPELDRWLLRGRPENGASESSTARRSPGLLAGLIAAVLTLAGGAGLLISILLRDSPPAGYKVEGRILSIIDGGGRTKWTIEIPASGDQSSIYDEADVVDGTAKLDRPKVAFLDADGNGKQETALFWNDDIPEKRGIALYDHKGVRLWLRELRYDIEYARTRWGGDFVPVQIQAADIDGDGRPEILALWRDNRECPSVFQVFSSDGEELGHYDHTGTFQVFTVFHRADGAADILLGGTNNLLGGDAVLVGLDGRDLPKGLGPPYAVPDDLRDRAADLERFVPRQAPPARQKFYVRIRHNEISRGLGTQWMWLVRISPAPDHISALLFMGRDAFLTCDFGADLALRDLRPGADFIRAFDGWRARGIVHGSQRAFLDRCRRGVSYWDGRTWTSQPTVFPQP